MSAELAEFLTACLDEDEAAAKAAAGPDWLEDGSPSLVVFTRQQDEGPRQGVRGIAWCSNGYDDDRANMAHIARHDPARVLREVEAGRHLIADYSAVTEDAPPDRYLPTGELQPEWAQVECLHRELTRRAGVYSDRPGYRQVWAP